MTGTIFDIQRFSVHDGPGIRTTVFLKGCPLRCAWCHNPEGLSPVPQLQFTKADCIGCNRCVGRTEPQHCPTGALKICGQATTTQQLLGEILKDLPFYGQDGGVTFSGGECLMQADFVAEALEMCKHKNLTTAVDTSGCVKWEAIEKTIPYTDLYLYDIKALSTALHKQYTGADNLLILENLKKLDLLGNNIWVRIPIIPDVNDTIEELQAIADLLQPMQHLQKVTLIPYHTLGKSKYETLGMTSHYQTEKNITKEQMKVFLKIFEAAGLYVDGG